MIGEKRVFSLNSRPFTPSPVLMARPLKKNFFFAAFLTKSGVPIVYVRNELFCRIKSKEKKKSYTIYITYYPMAVLFWYLVKRDFYSVRYCKVYVQKRHFLLGTRTTRPCLTGDPVVHLYMYTLCFNKSSLFRPCAQSS